MRVSRIHIRIRIILPGIGAFLLCSEVGSFWHCPCRPRPGPDPVLAPVPVPVIFYFPTSLLSWLQFFSLPSLRKPIRRGHYCCDGLLVSKSPSRIQEVS